MPSARTLLPERQAALSLLRGRSLFNINHQFNQTTQPTTTSPTTQLMMMKQLMKAGMMRTIDIHAEPYHPVEAFVGVMQNAKVIVYTLVTSPLITPASAMHVGLDHKDRRAGIWFPAILAMLLLSLVLLLAYKMGTRNERRRD